MEVRGRKNAAAYEELKDLFLHEEFEKGEIIPISGIAAKINMGRSPVTEALKRLESEKYVRIIPQKGVIVREMTVQEMLDLNDVRIALEVFGIKKVVERITPDDTDFLRDLMSKHREALEQNDPYRFRDLDESFHIFLSKTCGNSYLYDQVLFIREKVFNTALKLLKIPVRMESTMQEHQRIVDAIIANDAEKASACMLEHLEHGKQHIGLL